MRARDLLVFRKDSGILLHLQLGEGDGAPLPLRQLMRLGWKIFLPISLLWVFLVSGTFFSPRSNAYRPSDAGLHHHGR
jgi:hypothetical protein